MYKDIVKSIFVQFFGLFSNIGIQLLAIPVLLKFWGVDYYGEWLIMSSIASFLGLSDLGMGTAVSTKISILLENNQIVDANKLFNSTFYFILTIGLVMTVLMLVSVYLFPLHDYLSLELINVGDFEICFVILSVYILMALALTLPQGLYRVIGQFSRGQLISTIFRLLEFLLFILVVFLGGGCIWAAFAISVVRIVNFIFIFIDIKFRINWLSFSAVRIDLNIISSVLKPSLSLMGIALGQAFLGQGMLIIIGARGSSNDLVSFSVARTLVNFSKQIIGIINLSYWGELTKVFAKNNILLFWKLVVRLNQVNVSVTILASVFLYLFSSTIIKIWTNDQIKVDQVFFNWLIVYIILDCVWSSNWNVLMSINKHSKSFAPFIGSSLLSLIIIYTYLPSFGMTIVPFSLILSNIIMIVVVFRLTAKVLSKPVNFLIYSLFQIK